MINTKQIKTFFFVKIFPSEEEYFYYHKKKEKETKNVVHHHKTQINQLTIKITTLEIREYKNYVFGFTNAI